MKNKNIGHNMPPLTLNDFYLLDKDGERTGRIKLTNTICKKYLVRKYDAAIDDYTSVTVSDSEKIGLKARANEGGWHIADAVKRSYDVEGMHVGTIADGTFYTSN